VADRGTTVKIRIQLESENTRQLHIPSVVSEWSKFLLSSDA